MSAHTKLDLHQWPRPLLLFGRAITPLESCELPLRHAGYQVECVSTIEHLLERLERHPGRYAMIVLNHTLSADLQAEASTLAFRIRILTHRIRKPPHTEDSVRDIAKVWKQL